MSTKFKPLIPMKGPEKLAPEVIIDICESRAIPKAADTLAKKHGISSSRVKNIWLNYYGGTTLADYKTGLKKPLPNTEVAQREFGKRVIKTERAKYVVQEPKSIVAARRADEGSKASPMRKVAVRKSHDLDLDNVAALDDNDAQIMAGEVNAGNNSSELIEAIGQLIEHNQNISERSLSALEKALEAASRRRGRSRNDTDDNTDYSTTTDIDDYEDEDDSTTVGRPRQTRTRNQGYVEDDRDDRDNILGPGEDYREEHLQRQHAMGVYEEPGARHPRHAQLGQNVREEYTGHSARAQPVYRTISARTINGTDEEQGYTSQARRHEQEIPPAQYYTSQGHIQQGNSNNNPQQYTSPGQSVGLHSGSRAGPSESVPGHPWLKQRF
jgi:hypothetical protein